MSSSREALRLHDIIDNAESIRAYLEGLDYDAFAADRMRIDAVERCLERIIEAAVKVGGQRMAEIAPNLPMDKVRGLGNRLRHSYDLIDLRTLWDTATVQLPVLREACEATRRLGEGN